MRVNKLLISDTELDEDRLHYFESILDSPIIRDNLKDIEIEFVKANRWYGNIVGLLINELKISPNAVYINMRINGYVNACDYNGETKLKLLDPGTFNIIIESYLQNKALKKSLNL